jgi:CcmD family protein
MRSLVLLRLMVMAMMMLGGPALSFAQPPQQEGFVPVDQLPGQEELPATPLVAAAYGVAWAAVLIYLFTIWRRLAAVEREIADVTRRMEAERRR